MPRGSPNPDDEEAYLEGEGVASEGGDNARQESPYREIFVNQVCFVEILNSESIVGLILHGGN